MKLEVTMMMRKKKWCPNLKGGGYDNNSRLFDDSLILLSLTASYFLLAV